MNFAEIQAQSNIAMDLIFDHFSKDDLISFYKDSNEDVAIEDPSWNSDFSNPYADNIVRTNNKKEIRCRVWYFKDSEVLKSLDGDENISLKLSYPIGKITIQVKAVDFDWLKDSKSFYFDGSKYLKESDWRGVGMYRETNRYEINLKRSQ